MQRDVIEVAPDVLVTSSRRHATTSTALIEGGDVVLIDPAWDPDELDWLAEFVVGMRYRVRAGVATHAHHDHLLWHPIFGDAPRWASARTVDLVDEHRGELPFARVIQLVVHHGHAPGHAAVWLPDTEVLLAGDMLSDVELPLPLSPGHGRGARARHGAGAAAPRVAGSASSARRPSASSNAAGSTVSSVRT